MVRAFDLPEDLGARRLFDDRRPPEEALKDLRYVVASVDQSARKVWDELWRELQDGVTPAGAVTDALEKGFQPSCGWPEFLEKFWLLRHYLDYILRFCREAGEDPPPTRPEQAEETP
jgi:hypothetical protein